MANLYKYPHTSYLPWSPTVDQYDQVTELENFQHSYLIITEKMDGENITMYRDYIHARSLDDDGHVSKDWVKNYWAQRRYSIPEGIRICGECMYITHSLYYDNLKDYFLGFSAWQGDVCLSWEYTLKIFENCGIIPVPVLYEGDYYPDLFANVEFSMDFSKQEGYVVRRDGIIFLDDFSRYVGKFVRPKHVQTNAVHWKYATLQKNKLSGSMV